MFSQISGRSSFGLSTLPRSPPVQVTTRTSTPSATYFAMVAAPLLDSSSGCACTAINRSCSATNCSFLHRLTTHTDPNVPAGPIVAGGCDKDGNREAPRVVGQHATAGAPMFPPGRYGRRRSPRARRTWPMWLVAVLIAVAAAGLTVRLYQQYGNPDHQGQVVTESERTAEHV